MDNYIDIYTLNDFHGALFPNRDEPGIARLGCYLLEKRREDPDRTVILSSGDMFQGTAVSNLSRGEVVVAAMNLIGFDAMTIGNHEFDWGVPALRRFCDGDEGNGEASFPFLAANIRLKASGELVPWARPYMVIAKENARVGVIGVIGEDLINDILGSLISDYEFTDMLAAIAEYSKVLREKEGCGIVIVAAHADTMAMNERIAAAGADAIVNGHTHNYYAGSSFSTARSFPTSNPETTENTSGTFAFTLMRKDGTSSTSTAKTFLPPWHAERKAKKSTRFFPGIGI